jgi:thiosulfate/3-mercaptopyruvate sulfurtransferase
MRAINSFVVLVSFVTLFTAVPAATAGDRHDHRRVIVTTSWVHDRLKDPRLVLFQVGDRKEYDSLHLPGAQHLPVRDFAKPFVEGSIILDLPEPAALDSTLEARGVTDSSIIVIYPGKDWFSPSARIFLTLEWFGLGDRAYLMDGGMQAWIAEGKPVTADTPKAARGNVTPRVRDDVVVTKEWVREHLDDPKVAILDARNPNFYTGQDTGTASRPGHIPGARNLPFDTLVDSTGHYRKPDELKALFAAVGMAEGKTAVSYCHVGQQASLVWLMARVAGFDARMYDGSFQEWTRDPDAPVVKETMK